jgi:hypothetical protein
MGTSHFQAGLQGVQMNTVYKKVYKNEQRKQMRTLAVRNEKVGTCNTICGSCTELGYHLKIR